MDGAEAGVSSGPEHTRSYVRTRTRPGDRARREIRPRPTLPDRAAGEYLVYLPVALGSLLHDGGRKRGPGCGLVPLKGVQVVPDDLLVEAVLPLPRLVRPGRPQPGKSGVRISSIMIVSPLTIPNSNFVSAMRMPLASASAAALL